MPLTFNIRHLEHRELKLQGQLPVAELDLAGFDELIHAEEPLEYDFTVERHAQGALAQGRLSLTVGCECVRCLKAFDLAVKVDPWIRLFVLEGVDKVLVTNDCVDLTPYLREDIVLALPQHPLCEPECRGLPAGQPGPQQSNGAKATQETPSAWAALNKLKL